MINRFIDRPLFACVLSAFIVIAGLMALRGLSISLYPDILPPMIEVATSYPGATPEVSADTVASPLEQSINGAEGMIYLRSAAAPNGEVQVVATFEIGADIDPAVLDIQNRVQAALPLLPEEVRRQGVTVRKLNWTAVAYITLSAPDGRYDQSFLSNYAQINVIDELRRVPGVGEVRAFGMREYAIRIWLRPDALARAGLTPLDVSRAVREQNSQFATGRIGDPPMSDFVEQEFSITTKGRLSDPKEFAAIILKTDDQGRITRLGDVARVEMGARDYSTSSARRKGTNMVIGVFPQPGANLIDLSDGIKGTFERLDDKFPAGMQWQVAWDTSDFVRIAIKEVVKTLAEAIALVFLVVFVFLRSIRATIIPCLAVPVSLTGALAGMMALDISINLATLFAMVLSIGIVVDDAIVVVENVERHMRTDGLDAREATRLTMQEVSGPLIAIVLVLCAVFVPVAFLGGLVGEVYRQFAATISVSVLVSGFVALTLTPSLCALLLRHTHPKETGWVARVHGWLSALTPAYTRGAGFFLKRSGLALAAMAVLIAATAWLFRTLPTALVPDEDQGYIIALAFLPPASSQKRTDDVMLKIDDAFTDDPAMHDTVTLGGFDPYAFVQRSGTGISFITLKPWDERKGPGMSATELANKASALNGTIKDALIFGAVPPPIEGLSSTGGFEGFIQSRVGADYKALEAATAKLVAAAAQRPELAGVFTSFTAQVPQLRLDIDRDKAKQLGVALDDLFQTLQSTFGAYYVNDFNLRGRVYRVLMQADDRFRAHPDDLRDVYVRSRDGQPIPITALGKVELVTGPDLVERFNAFPAARILGGPAPGYSSGQSLAAMEELAAEVLPEGYTLAWNAQAYLEKESAEDTSGLYLLGLLMVFLILTAQYERLSLPLAVILTVPFAIFGALAATWLRGLQNDLYLQIGLVTLIGLAAKNAILIVEFASQRVKAGHDAMEAAREAAALRFRPILMTSLAFILGVLPLAISSGAGANARHSIATGVIGGMLAATFLATLFTPLFFVWTHRLGEALRGWFSRHKPDIE